MLSRRCSLRLTAGLVATAVLSASSALAADQVSVAMDWIINGTHAGFFVAKDKGYYTDEGLDVTISRGFGSGDTVKRVGTGASMLGVADTSAVVAGRANEDIPVQIVSMVYSKAPLGIIYLKDSKISKPQDFVGKNIAHTAAGSSVVMFPAFLEANGIERSKVKETVADANTLLPMLMSKRVDAVLGQTVNVARYNEAAKRQNTVVETMNYADYGLDVYGNAIIAGNDAIKNKPDVISRFVRASLKGFAYALEHPGEAVAIIKKAHPETDPAALREELDAVTPIIGSSEAKKKGIGAISDERMKKTIEVASKVLNLKRRLAVGDVYDSRFQPAKPILAKD